MSLAIVLRVVDAHEAVCFSWHDGSRKSCCIA